MTEVNIFIHFRYTYNQRFRRDLSFYHLEPKTKVDHLFIINSSWIDKSNHFYPIIVKGTDGVFPKRNVLSKLIVNNTWNMTLVYHYSFPLY